MGEVAYWSARAERTLAIVVTAFVSIDDEETSEIGDVLTRGLTSTSLTDLGTKLVKLHRFEGQVRETFNRLSGELKTAMDSRHHLLHGDWTTPREGPATASRARSRGTVSRAFTVEQVEDVAFDLAVLSNELFALFLVVEASVDYEEWTSPGP